MGSNEETLREGKLFRKHIRNNAEVSTLKACVLFVACLFFAWWCLTTFPRMKRLPWRAIWTLDVSPLGGEGSYFRGSILRRQDDARDCFWWKQKQVESWVSALTPPSCLLFNFSYEGVKIAVYAETTSKSIKINVCRQQEEPALKALNLVPSS